MNKKGRHHRHNSVNLMTKISRDRMINIYTGGRADPPSPGYPTKLYKRTNKIDLPRGENTSFETLSKFDNDYSPMLPSIKVNTSSAKINFLKQNMSIAKQVIRSYRSFSRRHAYNLKYEVTEPSEDQKELSSYDANKETVSTNAASSPKTKKNNRSKSQVSRTSKSVVPERVIQVKPIAGTDMLESIKETKETEKKLKIMKNRVEKLLQEKRKALSNIRLAKERASFMNKVNNSKEFEENNKKQYHKSMNEKLKEQQKDIAKRRREMRENIINSRIAKIEENRNKKKLEKELKNMKQQELLDQHNMHRERTLNLK